MRAVIASLIAQVRMTRRNIEDLMPVLTMPLFALVFMAVFVHSGRRDLAGYALIAPLLMTVGQMGFFVASELISNDRADQILELLVVTPTHFVLTVLPRIFLLTTLGLIGFFEAWAIARLLFGTTVTFHHPWIAILAMVGTVFASAGTALLTAALFCFGRSVRTLQNSVTYPLYLLGGVLVPVTFLPIWLQPASRLVFLYWAANLLRDSMSPAPVEDLLWRMAALLALGAVAGVLGAVLIGRMLGRLRRDGTMGLV